MNRGRRSITAAFAVLGLAILALAPAAAANHSVIERVSIGPTGGNGGSGATNQGISQDGTHVFFQTAEGLVSDDTDACQDVYERVGGTTTLISVTDGIQLCSFSFSGTSQDGARVFFSDAFDVYERSGDISTLISYPASIEIPPPATFVRASQDGSRVFFRTSERVASGDGDNQDDIFERSGGTTKLVSTGPNGGSGAFTPTFGAISADGTHAFFTTSESLVSSDTDSKADVYERAGGTTTLVSTGPGGATGPADTQFAGTSTDGTRVFFTTSESLVPSDTDSCVNGECQYQDVYERSGGTTTLISTGPIGNGTYNAPFSGTSPDGSRVFFTTSESMVSADTDSAADVYERSGGATTLVSTGPSGGNGSDSAAFAGVAAQGTRVFFRTSESFVASDTDSAADIYERAGGTTTLISTGPAGGNGSFGAAFAAASDDGTRVFFNTNESLVSDDTDGTSSDIYERSGGATTLISASPAGSHAATDAIFERMSQDGTRVVFGTNERLVSGDTDSAADVYVASTHAVTTGYPRPKSATPLFIPLVPVYEQCTDGNTTHGAPFAFESCNPPVFASDYLTIGTPEVNAKVANSIGSLRLSVILGNPSTPADEADLRIALSLTDVRRQSDLSDYTDELLVRSDLRITDKLNTSSQTMSATVADMPVGFAVPCTATADAAIGGACTLNTTLDGLIPGAVKESKRTIYKLLGDIEVFDGGADGDGETGGDNTLFAGSGLFVP